jgi:peptidoglycan hydrolase-like protein with peptidoglycan-binding domain
VQRALSGAGYYRGAIDGVIGPRTRAAIRAYERDNNLSPDGELDDNLLNALGVG